MYPENQGQIDGLRYRLGVAKNGTFMQRIQRLKEAEAKAKANPNSLMERIERLKREGRFKIPKRNISVRSSKNPVTKRKVHSQHVKKVRKVRKTRKDKGVKRGPRKVRSQHAKKVSKA